MDQLAALLATILYLLIAAVVVRALLSWFPGLQLGPFGGLIARVTEPILAPFRRVIPTLGPFDVSAMAVIIVLTMAVTTVNRALG